MNLDDAEALGYHLADMAAAGARAHHAATEDDGRGGAVSDLLFGVNSIIDALAALIREDYE